MTFHPAAADPIGRCWDKSVQAAHLPRMIRRRSQPSLRSCDYLLQPEPGAILAQGSHPAFVQCLTGGPLLFPGTPLMFDESCSWTERF